MNSRICTEKEPREMTAEEVKKISNRRDISSLGILCPAQVPGILVPYLEAYLSVQARYWAQVRLLTFRRTCFIGQLEKLAGWPQRTSRGNPCLLRKKGPPTFLSYYFHVNDLQVNPSARVCFWGSPNSTGTHRLEENRISEIETF